MPLGGRGRASLRVGACTEVPLRILHDGFAALRIIDDEERFFLVDPHETRWYHDVRGDDAEAIVLTGGPWAERYEGVVALVREGRRPRVVAAPPVLDWLGGIGEIEGHAFPATVSGTRFEAAPYAPLEPRSASRDRVSAALRRPRWAASRFLTRRGLPDSPPHALRIEVPEGHRLAHLGVSLHGQAPSAWIARARTLSEGAVLMAGYPHGESEAFVAHIEAIAPKRLLLLDQTADLRRAAGLPVDIITPTRDVLVDMRIETHPFVSATSFRFEEDDTIKRW